MDAVCGLEFLLHALLQLLVIWAWWNWPWLGRQTIVLQCYDAWLGCVVPGGIGLDLVDKPSSFSAMTLGWVVWSVKSSCKVSNGMLNRTMPCHIHVMSNTVLVLSTEQGHCGACRMKWWLTDTDLCPCGETQTMFYIVESCPLTKLSGGLSGLHSADEDAVSWLTSYGSWNAYEKKKSLECKYTDLLRTCLENLEMSGNLTAVSEMLVVSLKVREVSGKNLVRDKSCQWKVA